MSSANNSSRPDKCISIPVEIIPASNSRHNPSLHTFRHSDFYDSPTINSSSRSRFQPRQSPTTAYDRLIKNSQFNNRPLYQEPQYYPSQQSSFLYSSRSNEDLLSSPIDSKRSNIQSKINGFRSDSDFIQPNKHTNSLRRSFDVLNDVPDTQPTNINPVPTNHYQGTFNNSHDRSHSPASQRGESPIRPPPPPSSSSASKQQQQESDFTISKDAAGTSAPASSSLQSNDQQVPSTDISTRDPNTIALEKLEQIKQNLDDFNQQVDTFIGSTRDERAYKLLDEQALKIMLSCDELINVSVDIKEKRKEMIQNVQTVLAKLESKVPINPSMECNSNQMENIHVIYDPSINTTEQKKEEISIEQST